MQSDGQILSSHYTQFYALQVKEKYKIANTMLLRVIDGSHICKVSKYAQPLIMGKSMLCVFLTSV
jgi:hypothetical protein